MLFAGGWDIVVFSCKAVECILRMTQRQYKTAVTTRLMGQLLPGYLQRVGRLYQQSPDLILKAWPTVVGPQLAPMTRALSFYDGILTVAVTNSTLYSLLSQHDKPRIIQHLREKFPHTTIKTVAFRLQ